MNLPFIERRTLRRRSTDIPNSRPAGERPGSGRDAILSEVEQVKHKPLRLVLEKSKEVTNKIASCSDDLESANELLKRKLIALSDLLTAEDMLSDSQAVKIRVRECAEDLHAVNTNLAQTINELKQSEMTLAGAMKLLARTEAALAAAEDEKRNVAELALHDQTTGLPNRRLFDARLAQAISIAERHEWTLAVMFLDLDRFKSINDTLGHGAGDEVLKEVALRLMVHTRDEDTACRNGGDEFLFLLMNPQGRENIERVAEAILKDTAAPVDVGRRSIAIKASIGIAVYPENGTSGEELIKNADAAMYKAKKKRTGREFL